MLDEGRWDIICILPYQDNKELTLWQCLECMRVMVRFDERHPIYCSCEDE